jgi:hypothetical protein
MKKAEIGTNAGIIWGTLNDSFTDTEINTVMKNSKLKKEDFYMALGWLARENKIRFHTTGNTTSIFLVY